MFIKILVAVLILMHGEKIFSQGASPQSSTTITGNNLKDSFWVECANISSLPQIFQKGYVMVYRREVPGAIILVDVKGNIVWSHRLMNAGFKIVRYTKNHTFLCIAGTKENEIGYGNTILELSLSGDTLLFLRQGQEDFQQPVHHEILLNSKNQIVTLCREERVFNLSKKGGLETDTVFGDAIQVMDKKGRQIWKWSIFDKLDPLADENINKSKKDWMHANSIAIDTDGNYLVSFYNNGQIWKINAITGNVIWKFGKGGDFVIPAYAVFDQAHAIHINNNGSLMLFDNGANKKISRSLSFILDKKTKKAQPIINSWLPPPLYTDRMGSSYLINGNTLLVCASRHKTVALTNLQGVFLWRLNNTNIMSYRAEFIPQNTLQPYLEEISYRVSKN